METTKPTPVDGVFVATTAEVVPVTPQDARPAEPALKPELRSALKASWEQNEEAYRYLGR